MLGIRRPTETTDLTGYLLELHAGREQPYTVWHKRHVLGFYATPEEARAAIGLDRKRVA